ncbi:WYL domain-containing protein [Sphingomonas rubra]|uniref:WYL domain-containing protein n=1 Tax=Sphingomonas rubra TaxID=634430 RepID=UPI002481A6C8|nr:WYL domain-containing protein [Sphingomonas rubra]
MRGPFSTPITPLSGSLFHADPHTCVTVLAWCCLRGDFRMFRSDRITAIEADGMTFRPRRVALLREYVGRLAERRAEQAT